MKTNDPAVADRHCRGDRNAHVAVSLVYAGLRGHAVVDRELSIPRSWTRDADRCRAAGLGEDPVFAASRSWPPA